MGDAPKLLTTASRYAPDRLKVLGHAFDAAWETIASDTPVAPADIEATRTALARIIVRLPCSETDDAEGIKQSALQVMTAGYRVGADAGPIAHRGLAQSGTCAEDARSMQWAALKGESP